MKKLFFLFLVFGLQCAILYAQDGPPGGGPGGPASPKDQVKELKTKLTLTDDQTTKVEKILTDSQKKMQALFSKREEGNFETMKKTMDAISDSSDTAITKLLTDTQKAAYKKIIEERKKRQEQMGPPPGE